jgi:hypothetical protein
MNLTTEQDARFTAIINCFGDAFAQDRTDQRMHEWLAIIRNEMVDEWCVPVWHKELIPQLDWLDRVLDKIEARRKSNRADRRSQLAEYVCFGVGRDGRPVSAQLNLFFTSKENDT